MRVVTFRDLAGMVDDALRARGVALAAAPGEVAAEGESGLLFVGVKQAETRTGDWGCGGGEQETC